MVIYNFGDQLRKILYSFQIEEVKDFLKKRKDERYEELQKGVLLSETFAQIEENDLIK